MLVQPTEATEACRYDEVTFGPHDVRAEWFRHDQEGEGVLIYLHGGGYSIGSIETHRDFIARLCREVGVRAFAIDYRLAPEHRFPAQLEDAVRQDLNKRALRVMGVLRPVKVVIENYPEGQVEQVEAINNPEDETMGSREVPFSRELYVERSDFREDPPKKYFRLAPGREVRLRYAYFITCRDVVKDPESGEVVELRCTYDPETRGGYAPDGRKVRGTIHWVSAAHAVEAEVRLYDHLFTKINPEDVGEGGEYTDALNPASLDTLSGCRVEPSLAGAPAGSRYQFERQGYFCVDADSAEGRLVVNRTVTLRDTWAKIEKAQARS